METEAFSRVLHIAQFASSKLNSTWRGINLSKRGWTFSYSPLPKLQGGWCIYDSKRVLVNELYLIHRPVQEGENIVLHEIAHALAFERYGEDSIGHGEYWKACCMEVGLDPEKEAEWRIQVDQVPRLGLRAFCSCGYEYWGFERRPRKRYLCIKCRRPLQYERIKQCLDA